MSREQAIQALREALAQQRAYEKENWPFVDEKNQPTGTGESITYHIASLHCWSPAFVMTRSEGEVEDRLKEVWKAMMLAGDIISKYENATEALLKAESEVPMSHIDMELR